MYSLFLVLGVALVILSPLALELWLTAYEGRAQSRRAKRTPISPKAKGPSIAWASPRVR